MSMLSFAKAYVVVFLSSTVLTTFFLKKFNFSKKQFIFFWGFFVLALSVIAYNMNPPLDWDIHSHFAYLNQIRGSEISLFNFLFRNDGSTGGGLYTSLITFNIIRYVIVRISDNNFLFPAICVVIDYSILGYIIIDWSSQNTGECKLSIFTLILNFAFTPYIHAISGMRNIFSACIIGLAAYLYLYKKKHLILLVFLIFIAVTVHPAAIITVPFIFLAKINIGSIGFVAVFIISASAEPVAQRLSQSKTSYFALIGKKYLIYTSETQHRASRTPLYGVLVVTAVFLIIYFLLYRRFNVLDKHSNKKTLYNFLAIYMVYIWGNIGNYDMILRPAYVVGVLSPVLCSFLSDKQIWMHKGLKTWTENIISFGATAGNLIICLIVNYSYYIQLKDVL